MTFRISVSTLAAYDLDELQRWIAEQSDDDRALAYIRRIRDRWELLVDFPNRGTPRPQSKPDVRSLSFERRVLLAYRVEGSTVHILRIVSAARDQAALFEA